MDLELKSKNLKRELIYKCTSIYIVARLANHSFIGSTPNILWMNNWIAEVSKV